MQKQLRASGSSKAWRLGAGIASLAALLTVAMPSQAQAAEYYNQLNPGQTLYQGESLWSPNREYRLAQQSDGNLVLVQNPGNKPLWANGTNGRWGAFTRMQGDGNVVTVHNNTPVWATGTNGNWNSTLHVQDDSNVVVRRPGNVPIWANGVSGQGNCVEGDRNQATNWANAGQYQVPVAPVSWSESLWINGRQTHNQYKVELRYNPSSRCAWGLVSGSSPTGTFGKATVYLDRSSDGGRTWHGWLTSQTASASFNGATHTGVYKDGRDYWMRACVPRSDKFYCTGWW